MNKYLKTQDARMNVKPKIKMRKKKLQQDLDYAAGVFWRAHSATFLALFLQK